MAERERAAARGLVLGQALVPGQGPAVLRASKADRRPVLPKRCLRNRHPAIQPARWTPKGRG